MKLKDVRPRRGPIGAHGKDGAAMDAPGVDADDAERAAFEWAVAHAAMDVARYVAATGLPRGELGVLVFADTRGRPRTWAVTTREALREKLLEGEEHEYAAHASAPPPDREGAGIFWALVVFDDRGADDTAKLVFGAVSVAVLAPGAVGTS